MARKLPEDGRITSDTLEQIACGIDHAIGRQPQSDPEAQQAEFTSL
jgi:hypothetical protein